PGMCRFSPAAFPRFGVSGSSLLMNEGMRLPVSRFPVIGSRPIERSTTARVTPGLMSVRTLYGMGFRLPRGVHGFPSVTHPGNPDSPRWTIPCLCPTGTTGEAPEGGWHQAHPTWETRVRRARYRG